MKAYKVFNKWEDWCFVIWAKSPTRAKSIALSGWPMLNSMVEYTDLRVMRLSDYDRYSSVECAALSNNELPDLAPDYWNDELYF